MKILTSKEAEVQEFSRYFDYTFRCGTFGAEIYVSLLLRSFMVVEVSAAVATRK